MNPKKSLYRLVLFSLACFLISHLEVFSPFVAANASEKTTSSSLAQILTLPNRGAPGQRRIGAGSRSRCKKNGLLTALVPETNLGLTSTQRPTFWFYVPYTNTIVGEFLLKDNQGNEVYKQSVSVTKTPGIISIHLPKTVSPLAVKQLYTWSFSVVCDKEIMSVNGAVERVLLTNDTSRQLATATAKERTYIYAKNGLWFDLVTQLAQLWRTNPQNKTIEQDWLTLLEQVGLEDIASKSLVSCCNDP